MATIRDHNFFWEIHGNNDADTELKIENILLQLLFNVIIILKGNLN